MATPLASKLPALPLSALGVLVLVSVLAWYWRRQSFPVSLFVNSAQIKI